MNDTILTGIATLVLVILYCVTPKTYPPKKPTHTHDTQRH